MVLEIRLLAYLTMFLKIKSSVRSIFLLVYTICLLPFTCYFVINEISLLVEWTIISLRSCSITFTLIFNAVSLSFSSVVCLISGCVILFSSRYMSHDPFLKAIYLAGNAIRVIYKYACFHSQSACTLAWMRWSRDCFIRISYLLPKHKILSGRYINYLS